MDIVRVHARWVSVCREHPPHTFTEAELKAKLYGELWLHKFYGRIKDFYLDERGIVWHNADKKEYGMLSNVALILDE